MTELLTAGGGPPCEPGDGRSRDLQSLNVGTDQQVGGTREHTADFALF